jgi:uncharacterized protein YhaN
MIKMTSDEQLEQMIRERNEFENRVKALEGELSEMCQAMIQLFNGGWDEEAQESIDDEARRLMDKNKHYIKS